MTGVLDQSQTDEITNEPVVLVALGDVTELTLGEGGTGGEDKRYQYN